MKIYFFLLLFPVYLFATPKVEYSKLSKRYHKYKFHTSKLKDLRDDFLKLAKKYPNSNEANKSYYTSANLSYKLYKNKRKKDYLDFSIKYFSLICKNKKSYLADDACMVLYTIYTIYRKDENKSLYYAKYIIKNYPKSDSFKEALEFIKKKFPNHKIDKKKVEIDKKKVEIDKKKVEIDKKKDKTDKNKVETDKQKVEIDKKKDQIDRKKAKTDKKKAKIDKKKVKTDKQKVKTDKNKVKTDKNKDKIDKKKAKYTIVIDPGHGGNDSGAKGKMKKYEKDLVLDVALLLEKKLKNNKNYKVILTRRKDKYISLDDRTDIANKNKGDLFISIHINALTTSKYYGIETFYLNLAADNYSRRLERVENAEHQKKISDLQFILADLLKKANTKDSIDLAKIIQSSLVFNLRRKYKNIRNLGVKNAMFYVLLDTKMPSILVELGFITNRKEEKRLNNKKYQEVLASSLKKGIDNYFLKYKKDK